jgi:hypothetical protein
MAEDVVKLTRRLLVEGGVGQFAEALVGAAPQATGCGAWRGDLCWLLRINSASPSTEAVTP